MILLEYLPLYSILCSLFKFVSSVQFTPKGSICQQELPDRRGYKDAIVLQLGSLCSFSIESIIKNPLCMSPLQQPIHDIIVELWVSLDREDSVREVQALNVAPRTGAEVFYAGRQG